MQKRMRKTRFRHFRPFHFKRRAIALSRIHRYERLRPGAAQPADHEADSAGSRGL